ncbi:SusC/RagA family TonB-linked outer membrane protein [Spirosoma arcticum]
MKRFTQSVRNVWYLPLGFLLCLATNALAQGITVRGKVSAETDEGLPGVSVVLKGTNTGTVTDASGNYTLNVPNTNARLVVSFIGYLTQEVGVSSRTVTNVTLQADVKALDEVVVVGYGTQRKVDLTGAVSSVTNKEFVNRPYTNPDQVLAGRVSGVQISNRSGDPGAPIEVRIRGVGTTGNNQPLWVIDGVPIVQTSNISVNTASATESNPLAGINPNDIESMDVLKDASATAIYGARAANGVIIVTTKRGKEGRTSVNYDGYYGVQTVPENRRLNVLNVPQYIALQSELGRDLSAFAGKPVVDWQDAIFRTGSMKSHNITVNGGSKTANYNIGAGYLGQSGVERAQGFSRVSIKANSDMRVGDYLRFGESLLLSSTNRLVQSEGAQFAAWGSANNAPYFQIYDPTNPTGFNPENATTRGDGATGTNYVWRSELSANETRVVTRKALGSIYGEFEPIKGLRYRITAGADYNVGDGFYFQNAGDYTNSNSPGLSLLVQERPIELTTNLTNTLTFQRTFGKHDLTVLGGYEETAFRYDKLRLQGRGLFNTAIRFASVATNVASANEADQWALRGFLGRVNYSYNNKYLFTFNVRRDATSRFAEGYRVGIFPSFSAGWRLSEESFIKDIKAISDFKIRASWGQSGNQFTGQNFAYLPSLATTVFYSIGSGQTVVRGPAPITFANANLKWETSTQLDFGADVSLYNGKINLTFDYYNKTTNDVLLSQPIPATSGYFLPADNNLGSIRNSGIELAINYQNRIGELRYGIGGNITTVKNEVISLGGIPEIISGIGGGQTNRTTVGEPLGYFYGFKTDGIYQTQAEIDAAPKDAFSGGAAPGDIRFQDVNGDGKIDALDRTRIGSPIASYYYGINLSAGFKGFDFSALFQGVGDIQIFNAARQSLTSMNGGNNQLTSVLDRWTGPGTSNTIPRATLTDPNANTRFSDRWVESGSFLRLKNVQIGYTIPAAVLQKVTGKYIASTRLFIGAQNLLTFTKYTGYDPEVTRGFSYQKGEFPLATGMDSGSSPQPRIIQFGWSFTF